jgi:hypothetical protein
MGKTIRAESPNTQYVTLAVAFDYFNARLFAGKLPPVLITLQRKKGSLGYYSPRRFEGRDEGNGDGGGDTRETDEIALHPGEFKGRTDTHILSILVHEMVHHWQTHLGFP